MTPTYDQMGNWLEEIAAQFPDAFFEDLDGGIQLEEAALPDPAFPEGEMCPMKISRMGRCTCWGSTGTICWDGISCCITAAL